MINVSKITIMNARLRAASLAVVLILIVIGLAFLPGPSMAAEVNDDANSTATDGETTHVEDVQTSFTTSGSQGKSIFDDVPKDGNAEFSQAETGTTTVATAVVQPEIVLPDTSDDENDAESDDNDGNQ